jgi:hypothetical protein
VAYALLTEGMSLENRAAFDLTLTAISDPPEAATGAARASAGVVSQNREALKSWAALGVPVAVPK